MGNKINVLMTGAGAPGGPGILKALKLSKKFNVFTADANPLASGRFLSKNFFNIPKARDEDFISKLLNLCLENDIRIVFPLVTLELFELSKHKEVFLEKGIQVVVSAYEALSVVNDKGKILQILHKTSVGIPKFKIVKSLDELVLATEEMGYPSNPVVMKPCVGNGSRGIRVLDPSKNLFEMLFNEKPNSIYSDLETIKKAIDKNPIPEMLVSEYMPGDELTVDTIIYEGKLLCSLIRTRDTMNSGISTSGKFIQDDVIHEHLEEIAKVIPGLAGPIGFQFKKSVNGEYLLLECNPRIQGTSVAGLGLGVNLPELSLDVILGNVTNIEFQHKRIGFSRFYDEVFYEY